MLKLRYYQQQAFDAFFDYTSRDWGKHPIIVLPTGAGKSLVQAYIVKKMLEYKNTRILLITHQKELIKQNYSELIENFNNEIFLDVGIYSAGLNCRDTQHRIIFAGIQSVYKKAWELGWFDIILIDECHLLPHSGEGMYRTFLAEMKKINKNVVVGGLTATEFRLKGGMLTEGGGALFDDVCHKTTINELIDANHYKNLDKKQYLCKLVSKNAINKVDLSNVHLRAGEFISNEMEKAFLEKDLIGKAIKEIRKYTDDRKKILIFTSGIDHCEEVVSRMNKLGMNARCVHSQQFEEINQQNLKAFENGEFKYLINANMLTTGYNEKGIDCIVLLRSTMSPGLLVQMCGRGSRLHPDKENCLILDFGRNIERHGPIDKIEIRKKKDGKGKELVTSPTKECPKCYSLMHPAVLQCLDCGYEFPEKGPNHEEVASDADVISKWKKPKEVNITKVRYERHRKVAKPDSLRVDYYEGFMKYSTWVCLEHQGFARKKALQWIRNVTNEDINTVEDALEYCEQFRQPTKIIVNLNKKFPEITGYIFDEEIKEKESIPMHKEVKEEISDKELERLMF